MLIGICDDEKIFQEETHNLCEQYFNEKPEEHSYVFFSNGEEIISYCQDTQNLKIDLLFLDIEMGETNGIDIKDYAKNEPQIWRIVFVSSHPEFVFDTFSTKTLGFIPKPAEYEKIAKMIDITRKELKDNVVLTFTDYDGKTFDLFLDEIIYLKSDRNYTEVYTTKILLNERSYFLSSKSLKDMEKLFKEHAFIRTHKSYIVNFDYIIDFSSDITLKNIENHIPIGRLFREKANQKYREYGERIIRERL